MSGPEDPAAVVKAGKNPWSDPNIIVGGVIGLAVVSLFGWVVIAAMNGVSVAPVSANSQQGTDAYDPFARTIQVVGLVSPVLTTIVGFYFGVRAGASGREAAESRATQAESKKEITQRALTSLEGQLGSVPEAAQVLDKVREENPRAFTVESWLSSVRSH